jgi:hypothetical protein
MSSDESAGSGDDAASRCPDLILSHKNSCRTPVQFSPERFIGAGTPEVMAAMDLQMQTGRSVFR